MSPDLRHIALGILLGSSKKNSTLDKAIDDAKKNLDSISRQDRSLCNAIVFGVLRHQGRLDHLIRAFSKTPFEKIEPRVKIILRLGIFQIVFLDRVPDYAAINTSIELAKTQVPKKTTGFINAVLRQVADRHETIALPDRKKHFSAYLTAAFGIPTWLGKKWVSAHGKAQTENLSQAILEIPLITLRTNRVKISRDDLKAQLIAENIQADKTDFSPDGLNISKTGTPLNELVGFSQGHFQVQDEAAQLVSLILNPQPNERILDACAGLGTKTCHMAQLMDNQGQIVAADIDPLKLERLNEETQRLGISIVETQSINIMKAGIKEFNGYFDRVLVDAPCTGLGVMRRNPDTRWNRSSKDIQRLAAQQKKILNAAANLVKPGGTLVYAVCSCEPEENEAVITHFLNKRKDYTPDTSCQAINKLGLSNTKNDSQFKTYPSHTKMDGFFVACLKREKASQGITDQ